MGPPAILAKVRQKFEQLRPAMTEKVRRQWAASEALALQAMGHSGCHLHPRWAAATTYTPGVITTPPPLMPLIGKAHLAAEVLNGRLDGRIIAGPNGEQVVLLTKMGKQVIAANIETAERERGVVAKAQSSG